MQTKSNEVTIFLSLPRYDGAYTSTPWQLAVAMAKEKKVVFIDHPFTFIDLIRGLRKPEILKRLKAYFRGPIVRKDNVDIILSPFVFPINFLPKGALYNFFSGLNHAILARRINKYLQSTRIQNIVYINSFDFYFPKLHKLLDTSVSLNVYHCIDPMVKAFTLKHGRHLQELAAKEADAIVSTAPSLQKSFIEKGFAKSFLVPNAANYELFERASRNISIHESLTTIGGKVMGYLGNIERRIDYNLLLKVLELLPDWQLVLAGPVEKEYVPGEILNHNRVHFIGRVPHDQAPSVVKRFDVSIIPFKCDEASNGIYPLKLFEYLAAGKPLITTNFNPEILSDLKEVIRVATTAEQFAENVLESYYADSPALVKERQTIAALNNWESRARLFNSIISVELKEKHSIYVA